MIHERLKTETRHLHDRTEEIAGSEQIMSGNITLDEYTDILIRNYLLHLDAEMILSEWTEWVNHPEMKFQERLKTEALRRDLDILNVITDQLPMLNLSQKPENHLQALGAMYVLEGATLGGSVIHKRLSTLPQISKAGAFHYYTVYGHEIGSKWKQFLTILEGNVSLKEDEEEILKGAELGYQWVQEAFQLDLASLTRE
ncbi:MAG: biliverdin-producing heme oxygenase [Bacteroidota bacterium]|nr:biliverdin-producing heme oxygenase [Bacteroidota bacterium]